MKLNRRQTLIGLGALAGGTGALVGSGAFSSVEAERDFEVQTAGDEDALLALTPAGTETIAQLEENDILSFELQGNDDIGLNQHARTAFRPAFNVENNGTNEVNFYVDGNTEPNLGGVLDFQDHTDQTSIVGTNSEDGVAIDVDGNREIDIVIDLIDHSTSDLDDITTVTLVAESI